MLKANRQVEWQIPDPKHMSPEEFREVRDLIERKVIELLDRCKGFFASFLFCPRLN